MVIDIFEQAFKDAIILQNTVSRQDTLRRILATMLRLLTTEGLLPAILKTYDEDRKIAEKITSFVLRLLKSIKEKITDQKTNLETLIEYLKDPELYYVTELYLEKLASYANTLCKGQGST